MKNTVMRYVFRVFIIFFISIMSLPNSTPASSRRRSPRISAAATNKSAASSSSMTPLVTRTLYEDIEDAEDMDDEEIAEINAAVASHEGTQQSDMAQTIVGGKNFCDVDNCQGFNFLPGATCVICEADLHMECFLGTVRKLNKYPQGCHNEVFCSDVCCRWHGNDKVEYCCHLLEALVK